MDTLIGRVDLKNYEFFPFDSLAEKYEVRRAPDNKRTRPNAHRRHDPNPQHVLRSDSVHFTSDGDLEWLSVNYRKRRAAKISRSNKRMILVMFQRDPPYFPTLLEIRDELIRA